LIWRNLFLLCNAILFCPPASTQKEKGARRQLPPRP
jgi:hypothetical protein